jgi:FkbM family methyltransferase
MISASADKHSYTVPKLDSYQSQHGEDKWLDEYFHQKRNGFFMEVGAYDGLVLSNTYHFEKERAWTGILVEPDARKADLCRKNRPNSRVYECAAVGSRDIQELPFFQVDGGEVYSTTNLIDSHRKRLNEYGLAPREIRVRAMTLDQILAECQPPRIDILSIDVEEAELDVLNGLDIRRWNPRIVIIETNSFQRNPEIRDYFVRNGYAYLRSIEINDCYCPVLGGARVAKVIDHLRYRHARMARFSEVERRPYLRPIRRFLDKHILWRF